MTALLHPAPTTAPTRLTLRTCVVCGAVSQPGECAGGCHEELLDVAPAADFDQLAAVRCRARAAAEAFRGVAAGLTGPEPAAPDCAAAYQSIQQRARTALLRFPPSTGDDDCLRVSVTPEPAWWCPDCGGIEAPQPCLEMCIWMPVDWVDAGVYRREHERAVTQRAIESRWRAFLRRLASVTPRKGQAVRCWSAFGAEARALLDAADAVSLADCCAGGLKEVNQMSGRQDAAAVSEAIEVKVARDDDCADEYEHGVVDGREWAEAFAPTSELREIVGDLSGEGDPHWRGFVAGTEEVLAEREAVLNQPHSGLGG